jgi:hypothetical protein
MCLDTPRARTRARYTGKRPHPNTSLSGNTGKHARRPPLGVANSSGDEDPPVDAPTCYIFTHPTSRRASAQPVSTVTVLLSTAYKLRFVAAELLLPLQVFESGSKSQDIFSRTEKVNNDLRFSKAI